MALAKGVTLVQISPAKTASQYSFCQWGTQPYYFATCVNPAGNAVFYQSRDYGATWFLVQSLPNGVSTAVRKFWGGAELSTGEAAMVNLDVGYVVQQFPYPVQPSDSSIHVASGTPVPVPEISLTFGVTNVTAMCYGNDGMLAWGGDPKTTTGAIGGSLGLLYLWGDQASIVNFVNTNVDFSFAPIYWSTYGFWNAGGIIVPPTQYSESDNFPLARGKTGQMTGWVNGGSSTTGAAPYGWWFRGGAGSTQTIYQSGEDQEPRLWRGIQDTTGELAGGGGCAVGPLDMTSSAGQRSCCYGWVGAYEAVAGVDPGGTFYVSLRSPGGWRRKVVCSIGGVSVDYVWLPYSSGHLTMGFVGTVPGQGYGLYLLTDPNPFADDRRVVLGPSGELLPAVPTQSMSAGVDTRQMDHW